MPTIHVKLMNGKYGPCWTERNTKPKFIVDHHTASGWNGKEPTGGCLAIWNYWYGLRPGGRVSSTDIIGKNGYIMRCVDPKDSAWHAGTSEWNNKSIGIEWVNWGNNRDPYPERQLRAGAWLIHKYMKEYDIPFKNLTDHKAVYSGKIDMRANFPKDKLIRYIKELDKAPVSPSIILPVPDRKPPWWNKMLTWLRVRKKRR